MIETSSVLFFAMLDPRTNPQYGHIVYLPEGCVNDTTRAEKEGSQHKALPDH